MGLHTHIQWCDSTVNPTENCGGCELWMPKPGIRVCYAGKITERRRGRGAFDEDVQLFPGRMSAAAAWSDLRGRARPDKPWIPSELPRLIFVSDMSDALDHRVPFAYLKQEIISTVTKPPGDRHIWIWCTKRPTRMARFSMFLTGYGWQWPPNLWAICSVTDQEKAQFRIPHLLAVGDERTVRGISAEPLWGAVSLSGVEALRDRRLDWVIIGAESGRQRDMGAQGRILKLLDESQLQGIPTFVKQLGTDKAAFADPKGGDWLEWSESLRVREFPRPKIT